MTPRWRLAIPLTFLITIHVACLFGGFLAPNSALKQNRDLAWAPPTKLRFIDADGRFHWRPFVYPLVEDPRQPASPSEDPQTSCRVRFLVAGDDYRLGGLFPTNIHFIGVDPPARLYFFGTDGNGRDVFARALQGGSISLFAGILAATIALASGTAVGVIAGYYRGWVDSSLMRIVELFLALPWLYLLLALRAFLPLDLSPTRAFVLLVLVIGLIGWAQPARIVRGITISATERLFVTAARGIGASPTHLLRRHLLPQSLNALSTQAAILIPSYMLAEVALSFLGLGIAPPTPTWGNLLAQLKNYYVLTTSWWMLIPLVALLAVLLSYHQLHVYARDAIPALPSPR